MDIEELASLIDATTVLSLVAYLAAVTLVLGTLAWVSPGAMRSR
jgi:hypothetical protein